MTTYHPNFSDPRVESRIKRALGFACGVLSETKPHPWSTRYFNDHFGVASNPLSKWLRVQLLICTDQFYRFNIPGEKGICKKYILNKEGVRYLKEALKLNNIQIYPSVLQVAKSDHLAELVTGKFTYLDKTNRLWHPLQRYRRNYKKQILADHGYQHQYDIECCAPTLIHQYSQQLGMDQYLFAIRKYLSDKTIVRAELAKKLDLPVDAVKEIINALFAGAVISRSSYSDIFHILDGDHARIEFLKQDPFVQELIADIKTCWEYITPTIPRRRNTKSNRLLKITPKQKWLVYFELERSVINSVSSYLTDKNYRYFLEHDGWSCDSEIDQNELIEFVRTQIGYEIKIEYAKINNTQIYPSVLQVANSVTESDK